MHIGRAAGLASIWSTTVAGVLPPPDVTPSESNGAAGLNLLITNPESQDIRLPCPACIAISIQAKDWDDVEDKDWQWLRDESAELVLDFRITNDGEALQLNGRTIFPHQFQRSAFAQSSREFASVVSDSLSYSGAIEVTSSWMKIEQQHPELSEHDTIVSINYQILALALQQVPAIPSVVINVLQTSDGQLYILDVNSLPRSTPPSIATARPLLEPQTAQGNARECKPWLRAICELRSSLEDRLRAIRLGRPCEGQEDSSTHVEPQPQQVDAPHHRYGHGHHQHSHGHFRQEESRSSFPQVVHHVVMTTLVPILAGIVVGLIFSFIALGLASAMGCIYKRLTTRRKGGRAREESLLNEEKDWQRLLYHDLSAPPPDYTFGPPPYHDSTPPSSLYVRAYVGPVDSNGAWT